VLSLGTSFAKRAPAVQPGDILQLSTATTAGLRGAFTGLGGGPVLVRNRKPIKIEVPDDENYETSSMLEEHPRSAIGWNRDHFYFVTVDGRQRGSIGMTLEHLASYLIKLGCEEAMNLDGGGSATLWCDGKIRNQPCDGRERAIANSLMVLRKTPAK
jgi:exopolysaccharide biosynthesis protein